MGADKLLERLQHVRKIGRDKWQAQCINCQSKTGLKITESRGLVLINCFACHDTPGILSAAGLRLSDLFEKPIGEFTPVRKPYRADEVLDFVLHEAMTLSVIAAECSRDKSISPLNMERIFRSASRLNHLKSMVDRVYR